MVVRKLNQSEIFTYIIEDVKTIAPFNFYYTIMNKLLAFISGSNVHLERTHG